MQYFLRFFIAIFCMFFFLKQVNRQKDEINAKYSSWKCLAIVLSANHGLFAFENRRFIRCGCFLRRKRLQHQRPRPLEKPGGSASLQTGVSYTVPLCSILVCLPHRTSKAESGEDFEKSLEPMDRQNECWTDTSSKRLETYTRYFFMEVPCFHSNCSHVYFIKMVVKYNEEHLLG